MQFLSKRDVLYFLGGLVWVFVLNGPRCSERIVAVFLVVEQLVPFYGQVLYESRWRLYLLSKYGSRASASKSLFVVGLRACSVERTHL